MRPRRGERCARALRALALAAAWLSSACAGAALRGGAADAADAADAAVGEWWAFTAPWDPASARSVRTHGGALDVVVTGWIALDSTTALPFPLFPDTLRARLPPGTRAMAIVSSWLVDEWQTSLVRRLAADPMRLARAAGMLARHADSLDYAGLVVDFEHHEPGDVAALVAVIGAIRDSAAAHGVRPVVAAIPPADTAAYPAAPLARAADLLLPMLYDQHWSGSGAGPVSSPAWAAAWLERRIAEVGAERLVAGLPLYGYQWSERGEGARSLGWSEAVRLAAAAGVAIERDAASGSPRARLPGEWELWTSDAEHVARLAARVRALGVRRIALWRLGAEDPRLWTDVVGR